MIDKANSSESPKIAIQAAEAREVAKHTPLPQEDEREKFEQWANAKGTMGKSWNGGYYENPLHQAAWQAWKARAELREHTPRTRNLDKSASNLDIESCHAGPTRNIPIEEYQAVIEENEHAPRQPEESLEEAFYRAYPLEPWQIKANGIGVARAIQRINMKREWDGFKKAWELRDAGAPSIAKPLPDEADEEHKLMRGDIGWYCSCGHTMTWTSNESTAQKFHKEHLASGA